MFLERVRASLGRRWMTNDGPLVRELETKLADHLWGRPCAIEALEVVARRHRLELLFDAAHAFGCSHRGMRIGRFGGAEVFSFHATKFFTTGEGGAVSTDDDELASRLRRMRNFGF